MFLASKLSIYFWLKVDQDCKKPVLAFFEELFVHNLPTLEITFFLAKLFTHDKNWVRGKTRESEDSNELISETLC